MKIRVTVNFGQQQVTRACDLAGYTGSSDDDAVLVLTAFGNGDIVRIPLDPSRIEKMPISGPEDFKYSGTIDISDADFIRRAGKADQDTTKSRGRVKSPPK